VRGLRNSVVPLWVISLVRRLGAIDDSAARTQFRCTDCRPAVAGPDVVPLPAFTWRTPLSPPRLLDAVPVRAVQRTDDGPALPIGHKVADIRVRELVAWRASHVPVLQPATDNLELVGQLRSVGCDSAHLRAGTTSF
jgi:hypothetical protein